MKKILRKILLFIAPYLAYFLIRFLMLTMKFIVINDEKIRRFHENDERIIMALWHGRLLMMPKAYGGKGIDTMISLHEDGEVISRAMELFNIRSVRGSTTRGGTTALREMVKNLKNGRDLVLTPDGPKGPRHVVQNGAVILAKMTGAPLCPVTFNASKKKQFSSWDGFILPRPFSKGVFIWGDPVYVDKNADKAEIEKKRQEVEKIMLDITEKADNYF